MIIMCALKLFPAASQPAQPSRRTPFFFVASRMSWKDAKAHCVTIHAELATVISDSENDDLVKAGKKGSAGNGWIGCNDIEKEGVWQWVDGTKVNVHVVLSLFFVYPFSSHTFQ